MGSVVFAPEARVPVGFAFNENRDPSGRATEYVSVAPPLFVITSSDVFVAPQLTSPSAISEGVTSKSNDATIAPSSAEVSDPHASGAKDASKRAKERRPTRRFYAQSVAMHHRHEADGAEIFHRELAVFFPETLEALIGGLGPDRHDEEPSFRELLDEHLR
jgi:hypothetical protein